MSLKPSYPDTVPGQGFIYKHTQTGASFQAHNLVNLHKQVSDFCQANGFVLNNEEFEDNVCRSTPNIVCQESLRGLGDIVHVVLNPITKVIDAATGSNLQGCGGCFERQQRMNA
jgi:hypothetical protein